MSETSLMRELLKIFEDNMTTDSNGINMSNAAKERLARTKARNDAIDDELAGKGFKPAQGKINHKKDARYMPTQQAKADAKLSHDEFHRQADKRMQDKTGIKQPKIKGVGKGGFIDPSQIRDNQIAAKNDARPSVKKSKFK